MDNERSLLLASLAGDMRAFETLVGKYQSMVCAITFSAAGRVDVSEELAQETFLRAWQNLIQLKDLDKFRYWLCSIARNCIQNRYRKRHAEKVAFCDSETFEELPASTTPTPSEILISQEEQMILSEAILRLPEEYREPLVLFYRQGQSTKEVAVTLELNEATVRTRLLRGRQMLKDEVATMVERTLEKTGPSKAFTGAVMVAIGGLAAGTAATAAAASTGLSGGVSTSAAGGASAATTGFFAAAGVKVAAIAAAVILGTGALVYSYWNSSNQPVMLADIITSPQTQEKAVIADVNIKNASVIAADVNTSKVVAEDPISQPQPAPQPVKRSTVRHPDWPKIGEPVKYIYSESKEVGVNGVEGVQKLWVRLPDAFRDESQLDKITVDNGKQRLVLDSKTKQALIEPTWYKDGKMIWQFHQSLEEHAVVDIAKLFRDPNSNPRYSLTKLIAECDDQATVYQVKINGMEDSNGIAVKIWVDNQTRLPEEMEGVVVGDPNKFGNLKGITVVFDFAPIPDKVFSLEIPVEYKALPTKQPRSFSGRVIDLLGQPVAGADVYLHNWTLGNRGPLKGKSDENGLFVIPFLSNEIGFSTTIGLWAKLPDDPDFIGWTLLLGQAEQNTLKMMTFPLGGTIPGSQGVVYYSDNGDLCVGASDIILVMEPANKVYGWVRDTQGNAVPDANVCVFLGSLANQRGVAIGIGLSNNHPKDLFTAQTDEQGYYEIGFIPRLWKKCEYNVIVEPPKGLVGDRHIIYIDDPNQPIQTDFTLLSQGPTVRGIVIDNYGTPLSERNVYAKVNGKQFPGYQTKTDKKGQFELKGCPADSGLQMTAALSFNSIPPHETEKYNSYVFYPDITVDVSYQPGQEEYEVKLIATLPEIEIEAVLTDSAGNPLPYFPVEMRAESTPIPLEWALTQNFHKRTDENGRIQFINVPEMKDLHLVCSVAVAHHREAKEILQYLEHLDQEYRNKKYHWTEALVSLIPGQKKYVMAIPILTEEEYERQTKPN
jgi:RNA polymerase sigma factor (sigma-70 family)